MDKCTCSQNREPMLRLIRERVACTFCDIKQNLEAGSEAVDVANEIEILREGKREHFFKMEQ